MPQSIFRYNGETFKTEPSSKYSHSRVYALGSYRNSPFVTGHDSSTNGLKTEILDHDAGQWNDAEDYPFSIGDRFIFTMILFQISCKRLFNQILIHLTSNHISEYISTQPHQQNKAFI